jgi:hypothetical protein
VAGTWELKTSSAALLASSALYGKLLEVHVLTGYYSEQSWTPPAQGRGKRSFLTPDQFSSPVPSTGSTSKRASTLMEGVHFWTPWWGSTLQNVQLWRRACGDWSYGCCLQPTTKLTQQV